MESGPLLLQKPRCNKGQRPILEGWNNQPRSLLGVKVNDLLPGEVAGGLAAKVAVGSGLLVAGAVQVQVASNETCPATTSTLILIEVHR